MRITDLTTVLVELPLVPTLRTAIHEVPAVHCVLLTLGTDDGVRGEGLAMCFGAERAKALDQLVQSLRPEVLGRDPLLVEAIWQDLFRSLNFLGQAGMTVIAMTPIDLACWDIIGKAAGQPLYKLFGGYRERVPVYNSSGLWLSTTPLEVAAEAADMVEAGFRAVKLRLGSKTVGADVARVEAVRDAIGPEIGLMVDANQGLTVPHAIRLGRELERFDLVWFEEPVATWDYEGHAEIAAALDTPIASGETEYLRLGLRHMIDHRSADLLMPDLQRMGGYSEFLRVIGQIDAAGLPFSPHLFTEHSAHLVASSANAPYVEWMPWFGALYGGTLQPGDDGMIAVPSAPGVGVTFDWDAIESYRI